MFNFMYIFKISPKDFIKNLPCQKKKDTLPSLLLVKVICEWPTGATYIQKSSASSSDTK